MDHAKNYETASTFVNVIKRKLLFFRTRCILSIHLIYQMRTFECVCDVFYHTICVKALKATDL